MSDITASARVSAQVQGRSSSDPYVREIQTNLFGPLLKDLISKGRYVTPSAITAVAGLVTIPAGTVFYLTDGDGIWRFELISAVTVTGTATLNKIYLATGINALDITQRVLLLEAAAAVPAGALEIGTISGDPLSTITLNTQLDKAYGKSVFISVKHPAIETATSIFVPSPIAGTIKKVYAVANVDMDATTALTLKIATVAVTNGAVSMVNAGVAGTVYVATPTAANVVQKGQAIEILSAGSQTAVTEANISIEIEP